MIKEMESRIEIRDRKGLKSRGPRFENRTMQDQVRIKSEIVISYSKRRARLIGIDGRIEQQSKDRDQHSEEDGFEAGSEIKNGTAIGKFSNNSTKARGFAFDTRQGKQLARSHAPSRAARVRSPPDIGFYLPTGPFKLVALFAFVFRIHIMSNLAVECSLFVCIVICISPPSVPAPAPVRSANTLAATRVCSSPEPARRVQRKAILICSRPRRGSERRCGPSQRDQRKPAGGAAGAASTVKATNVLELYPSAVRILRSSNENSCPRRRIAHSSWRETDVARCRTRRPIVPLCRSFRALACTSSLKWNDSERGYLQGTGTVVKKSRVTEPEVFTLILCGQSSPAEESASRKPGQRAPLVGLITETKYSRTSITQTSMEINVSPFMEFREKTLIMENKLFFAVVSIDNGIASGIEIETCIGSATESASSTGTNIASRIETGITIVTRIETKIGLKIKLRCRNPDPLTPKCVSFQVPISRCLIEGLKTWNVHLDSAGVLIGMHFYVDVPIVHAMTINEVARIYAFAIDITAKYEPAQKEMGEHTSAMDSLIEISKYSYERFESLITKHQCRLETAPVHDSRPQRDPPALRARAPVAVSLHSKHVSSSHAVVDADYQNIIMYSDELGMAEIEKFWKPTHPIDVMLELYKESRFGFSRRISNTAERLAFVQIEKIRRSSRFAEKFKFVIFRIAPRWVKRWVKGVRRDSGTVCKAEEKLLVSALFRSVAHRRDASPAWPDHRGPILISIPIWLTFDFDRSLAFNSEPGLGLSRLGLRSPALISDLGTIAYSDYEHDFGLNFNSTLNSNHGSVLDFRFCSSSCLQYRFRYRSRF
ncbi:hypothetical protein EVAR_15756_1 [Eumeta japonica]|uniref:Uncharacterized protein n=1 Tax=Eumeta variegata TaxID=151549 RepID=A0A4C1TZQ4_EUMVA|nr:hypothetical protein EVAR_15756_1 [Eumeta japonica]